MLYVWELLGEPQNQARIKQEAWFDNECIKQVCYLMSKGFSEQQIIKKFEIIYCEQKHRTRFLLDDALKASGYDVTRHHFNPGDVIVITISKKFQH